MKTRNKIITLLAIMLVSTCEMNAQPLGFAGHSGGKIANGLLEYYYVAGGKTPDGILTNNFWKFDNELMEWEEVFPAGDIIPPFWNAGFSSGSGCMYIFGGQTQAGFSAELYRYKVSNNTIDRLSNGSGGPCPRIHAGVCYVPVVNLVYVVGGISATGSYLNDTWVFNANTGNWSNLGNIFPANIAGLTLAYYDEMLYGFGGKTGYPATPSSCCQLYRFVSGINVWQPLSFTGSTGTRAMSAAAYDDANGRWFFAGGEDYNPVAEYFCPIATAAELDLDIMSASSIFPMDTAITGATGAFFSNGSVNPGSDFLVVYGGIKADGSPNRFLYRYDFNLHLWSIIQPANHIAEKETQPTLCIISNPVTDRIVLRFTNAQMTKMVKIYNGSGYKMAEIPANRSASISIDVSSWPSGIYYLQSEGYSPGKIIKL